MVYGGFTDNNAHIIKKEQMKVLQSAIERKDVKIVAEQFINDWKKEEAQKFAENALTQNNDNVDVFLVSNDGMAGGVIQALERRGLAGKILVTGQDAELAALQLIAEGKQTMTIYKPIVPLARGAIDAALKLAKKEPLTEAKPFYNDVIKKEIPAILLDVFVVDKDNLVDTVIKDGYADYEKVFANVPPEKRPPKKF
jgi:D-xylose transport system substrate-binding protein